MPITKRKGATNAPSVQFTPVSTVRLHRGGIALVAAGFNADTGIERVVGIEFDNNMDVVRKDEIQNGIEMTRWLMTRISDSLNR